MAWFCSFMTKVRFFFFFHTKGLRGLRYFSAKKKKKKPTSEPLPLSVRIMVGPTPQCPEKDLPPATALAAELRAQFNTEFFCLPPSHLTCRQKRKRLWAPITHLFTFHLETLYSDRNTVLRFWFWFCFFSAWRKHHGATCSKPFDKAKQGDMHTHLTCLMQIS